MSATKEKNSLGTQSGDARMKAPPSTAYRIVDVPEPYADVIKRHGSPGAFVGTTEKESPWVPFGDNAAIRHLHFDPVHNTYSNILWIKSAGVIGTHRHRGTVVMVCLEGSVRYLEYDWVAHPGGFIYETPGITHTLVTDNPEGVKLFGWLQGATEFYDEHGNFVETLDVWWFINHYESYCREHGLPINKELYI
ncbi:MAG TPA: 2,4'-dihydroxyacetophenone dioxygenase family protein [Parvularculaceae bacterium]|nr:2,4'-dihydroxyacetophenone dioxygenase family protein [Parvularculaceae bacterium]